MTSKFLVSVKHGLWIVLFIEFFILINPPCVINRFITFPSLIISGILIFLVFMVLFLVDSKRNMYLPKEITVLATITSITWFLYALYHGGDESYLTRIFFVWLTYLVLSVLYRKGLLHWFWHINNRFILVQAGLGLLCFVLVGVGVLKPLLTVYDLGIIHRPTYFFGITFSNSLNGNIVRSAGVFDEPGALAFWAIYALLINYCFIKDKIVNRYLPYFTVCTLSMAFFIQIAFYAVLKNAARLYRIVILIAFVLIAISFLKTTKDTDTDLYYYTLRRFELSDEKGFEGNNRKEQTDNAYRTFMDNPYFGIGGRKAEHLATSAAYYRISDNPYEVLAKDGIVGFFVTYLPIIFIIFSGGLKNKKILIAIIVLLIGYLQRPFHINFVHYFYLWNFYLMYLLQKKHLSCDNNPKKLI